MERNLHIEILTPYGKYLSTDGEFLGVTSTVSTLGILPNHAPLITTLSVCKLTITTNGKNNYYAISEGVMHIEKGSKIILLVDSIEHSDEIDLIRAKAAKERAQTLLNSHDENVDIKRAKAALNRALNRISVGEIQK